MAGVSLGFFTPSMLVKDVPGLADRVRELSGILSRTFPRNETPQKGEIGLAPVTFVYVAGALPIHVSKNPPASMFHLVIATRGRPCLLTAPASRETMKTVLDPDSRDVFVMGALELRAGLAVHFNPSTHFQSIVGMPEGDSSSNLPEAVILQVPWAEPTEIQRAISIARQALVADGRFSDLVRG